MTGNQDIIFEDLHGTPDMSSVEVDLDTDSDGISRGPLQKAAESKESDGDSDVVAAPKTGADDDDEGGDSKNSFEKRLERERRAKLKERQRAEAAEARLKAVEARSAAQLKSLSKAELKSLDDQIEATRSQLTKAVETGETEEQVKLYDRLAELRADRKAADLAAAASDDDDADGGSAAPARTVNAEAEKWMAANNSWYSRSGFERQTRVANEVDAKLASEGYDQTSPEYFEEMDKRLRKRLPGFFDDQEDHESSDRDTPPRKRTRPGNTVAGVDGDDRGAVRAVQSGKVTLGPEDFAVMRRFGLDPKNPEHLKSFAAERRQTLLNEKAERDAR